MVGQYARDYSLTSINGRPVWAERGMWVGRHKVDGRESKKEKGCVTGRTKIEMNQITPIVLHVNVKCWIFAFLCSLSRIIRSVLPRVLVILFVRFVHVCVVNAHVVSSKVNSKIQHEEFPVSPLAPALQDSKHACIQRVSNKGQNLKKALQAEDCCADKRAMKATF